jgi:hypothetical protein
MKPNKITFLVFSLLVGASCQNDMDQQPVSEYKNKITEFTSFIKSNNELYVSQIEELENAIDFRTVKKFNLTTTEKLLVANLGKLQKLTQADQLRVIFFLNNNEVVRAQIVAFDDKSNTDPNQVISSILNMRAVNAYSGTVTFYSVFQNIQMSSTFNNGKLSVNSMARKLAKSPTKNGKSNACTDWYFITTYHYEGGATQTVEVYLFTSCDEPCGLAGARVNCGGGGGSGGAVSSTQFPPNPQNGDVYETTDASGFYTKYIYDAVRMIWVGVERILPGLVLQDNPGAYPFLQNIRWPVDGQKVIGPDNMVYTYNGSSGSWIGEALVEVGNPDPFAIPIPNIVTHMKCFDPTISAKITIYADQPVPNSNQCSNVNNPTNVGHSFISIQQGDNVRTVGFYPSGTANPLYPDDPAQLKDNAGKEADVSVTFNITPQELDLLLAYIKYDTPNSYNLNSFNCTNWVVQACARMGINLPQNAGSWPGGGGLCPGRFGEDLKNLSIPNREVIKSTPNQTVAASKNKFTCN